MRTEDQRGIKLTAERRYLRHGVLSLYYFTSRSNFLLTHLLFRASPFPDAKSLCQDLSYLYPSHILLSLLGHRLQPCTTFAWLTQSIFYGPSPWEAALTPRSWMRSHRLYFPCVPCTALPLSQHGALCAVSICFLAISLT